jgi:hypothetical protein
VDAGYYFLPEKYLLGNLYKVVNDGLLWILGIIRDALKMFDILISKPIDGSVSQRQCKLTQGVCALTQSGAPTDIDRRTQSRSFASTNGRLLKPIPMHEEYIGTVCKLEILRIDPQDHSTDLSTTSD